MTAQGPRKGEPSSRSMRNGLRPQPARLVRGSSRRIMSMRFRPANIRVINRRDSYSAVIGPAVQTRNAQSSPTGTCSRYAARPRLLEVPERCSPGKGSLRRAKGGRALAGCAPFRPSNLCDGRLRREHFRIREVPRKEGRPAPLLAEESRPEIRSLTVSRIQGLTGRSISEIELQAELHRTRSIQQIAVRC